MDGHFHRHFKANEIYELHGSLENWQCAGIKGMGSRRQPCSTNTWQIPSNARFRVDTKTMKSVDGPAIATCQHCQNQARPNVLMFHDKSWVANVNDEVRSTMCVMYFLIVH